MSSLQQRVISTVKLKDVCDNDGLTVVVPCHEVHNTAIKSDNAVSVLVQSVPFDWFQFSATPLSVRFAKLLYSVRFYRTNLESLLCPCNTIRIVLLQC